MKLALYSHKPCWPCDASPTGFATDGGFPFHVAALSELFDETILLVPVYRCISREGEIPLVGTRLRVVPLLPPFGSGPWRKLLFPAWLICAAPKLMREFFKADAVHAPIPGDVGTVGMLFAWVFGKPLFVRHCGNWLRPATWAERFWRWFMERSAGGRNVMLATGGAAEPPSKNNSNVRWIFSTSLTQRELNEYANERVHPGNVPVRLIIVARQEKAKGAATVIQSLPLLSKRFPQVCFDVVGEGSAMPAMKQLARESGVNARVHFHGKLNHGQVMQRLAEAHAFVFPTTSSDGFPKAVLEAMASGLPVVATRVSVLPQLLGTGSGVLLDEATPQSVARGVERVLENPVRYEEMSRKAVETARQYSLEAWRDQIGAMLEKAWGRIKKAESRKQNEEIRRLKIEGGNLEEVKHES